MLSKRDGNEPIKIMNINQSKLSARTIRFCGLIIAHNITNNKSTKPETKNYLRERLPS